MPAGEPFSSTERDEIEQAVKNAGQLSGLTFSVYVGNAGAELRPVAEGLHAQLPEPARSVLVVVEPAARLLEIVTGEEAKRSLKDDACKLAALSMATTFAGGDLVGGIAAGVQQLGDHAHQPATLHADRE